jgi:hypothetical protein
LSVTVNWKVKDVPVAPAVGAVKVGLAAAAFDNVTFVPAVCLHAYVAMVPSGSFELEPTRATGVFSTTVWSGPASAVGVRLAGATGVTLTMHVSVALSPPLSATLNWKVRVVPVVIPAGAVRVGFATAAFDNVTGVPAV